LTTIRVESAKLGDLSVEPPGKCSKQMSSSREFAEPPWTTNHRGEPRQVGVEMEMAGVRPEDVAKAVTDVLGGRVERESAFYTRVVDTELGEFGIELDADVLRNRGYQEHLAELGIDIGQGNAREQLESVLSRIAGLVVPLELVGPPVAWTELGQLDKIRRKLHQAGARGTGSSAFYAFGLQLNIDIPDRKVETLLALLQAFLLRYDWLNDRSEVDLARRISPYVQPYPEDYVVHVLDPDYQPDLDALIDDFLHFTPTRNRPLDMLPLFAWLDEDKVMQAPVEKDLIKARPALHYRLPNCLIDEPDWSLSVPWNDWIEVERLAADSDALASARLDRQDNARPVRHLLSRFWRKLRS